MGVRHLSFEDFLKLKNNVTASFADDVIVIDRDYLTAKQISLSENMPPVRIDALVIVLCKYGELSLDVNGKTHRLTRGSMLLFSSLHVVENIRIGNTCEAVSVVVSRTLTATIWRETSMAKRMMTAAERKCFELVLQLEDNKMRTLLDRIASVKKYLKHTDHTFQSHIIRSEVSTFVLDVAHILLQKLDQDITVPMKKNRSEEISFSFIQLVIKHFKEQHEVSYYAGQLSVTPGHLSRILVAATGKSPCQLISRMLITEAKILLRKSDATVKQVAHELNFGNQASFSKFFKKHTGVTPIEYKKSAV
jgi:AraC-like DNA-binding protein